MKFAIIAAGEGSRLAQEGINVPKPLVSIGGECLIDRLIRIFTQNGASEIAIICRKADDGSAPMTAVAEHLADISRRHTIPVRVMEKATPSSMHSFYELRHILKGEPFILTTVDTIFREDEFAEYVSTFKKTDTDALMGVTDYIDDEKPLYVQTQENGNGYTVTAFLDKDNEHSCRYISGGIYGLKDSAFETLERCMAGGQSRMRNFQRGLIDDGLNVQAYPFTKVLDIDHKDDIQKAECFIKNNIRS